METFKNIIIILLAVVLMIILLGLVRGTDEPNEAPPVDDIGDVDMPSPGDEQLLVSDKGVEIFVKTPKGGVFAGNPIMVSGRAPGNWFFEASAPITLTNASGLILDESYVMATEEWMTTDYVPFEGTITIPAGDQGEAGFLIFRKDNPSGLPEHDDAAEMRVQLR